MQTLPPALGLLGAFPQFIVYKLVPKKNRPGKMDKIPIDHRTGRMMARGEDWQNDPATQTDAQTAIAMAQQLGKGYGVGFLFTRNDPFFFLDIDGARQADGRWSELSTSLCQQFNGAAVELSQSGEGLHIFGTITGETPAHSCRDNGKLGLELYTEGRFVALTGVGTSGDTAADMTAQVHQLVAQYFPPKTQSAGPAEWTASPLPGYGGPEDDEELIAKMLNSGNNARSILGGKATIGDLWRGDADALHRAYPDEHGDRMYDASKADAALASRLAFWTGCDCDRIERLMWRSGLARDKWTDHATYLQLTITGAVGQCDTIYTGGVLERVDKPLPESNAEPGNMLDHGVQLPAETVGNMPIAPNPAAQLVDGFQYLAATQQMQHFAGCVYIQDVHRVYTPRGALLKPEQFKATYGGYTFALDATNDKTTKSAWEAFTESQAVRYPMAEGMTFRPEIPPGTLLEEEGRYLVNTYTPAHVERKQGDAAPFLKHLALVLPDERDRTILLSYMAACVQHIGIKFQWAPLMQGAPGNGKTLFSRCVAYAVGYRYSHFPKAEEVGSKFNSWMLGRLFIGVEDVYYPDHKREIVQALLPLITNEVLPIELKGVDQFSARVCANFMLNANLKEAIRKTRDDRRFCIFLTAQQSAADIVRDGMGGDYFPDLYNWLNGDGYAIVADYLATYPIPEEFNPATKCHRAPVTTTTEQAIQHGVGTLEQEILEAIDEGRQGFAGGWVSSHALDRLLEDMRLSRAIPPNRRRDIMRDLGYDWHPALRNGRVNNPIGTEGGKPRLYIKNEHPDLELEYPAEVARAYQAAQSATAVRLADQVFSPTIDSADNS